MTTPIAATAAYRPRPIPFGYDAGWMGLELSNIARALPSQKVRAFTATSTNFTDIPRAVDHTILYDSTAHAITVQLPQPDQASGLEITLKRINGGANLVTLVGTIDGAVNPTLNAQYKAKTIVSDGLTYYVLATV